MQRFAHLRSGVSGRRLEISDAGADGLRSTLVLSLSQPLDTEVAQTITLEAAHALRTPLPLIVNTGSASVDSREVRIDVESLPAGSLPLPVLVDALALEGSPLGAPLAGFVLSELAVALAELHKARSMSGEPRRHDGLQPRAVILTPQGRVRLLGNGLPVTSALVLPEVSELESYRYLSPEAARGEPMDPRSDVYSLGVLYYELLSGEPYRRDLNAASLAAAAVGHRPPDLPASLPDPRPSLVHFLTQSLAPEADQRLRSASAFRAGLLEELELSGIQPAGAPYLARSVDEFVPRGIARSLAHLFEAVGPDGRAFERTASERAQAAALTGDITLPSPPTESNDWHRVVDDVHDPETSSSAPTIPAPPAGPPRITLPNASSSAEVPTDPPSLSSAPPAATRIPAAPPKLDFMQANQGRAAFAGRTMPTARAAAEEPLTSNPTVRVAALVAAIVVVLALGAGAWLRSAQEPELGSVGPVSVAPDAGARPEAHPDATVLKRPSGLLSVLSQPTGAAVEIDGGYVGQTPLVLKHPFESRSYRLKVFADGYQPWVRSVKPDPENGSISVMAVLLREP